MIIKMFCYVSEGTVDCCMPSAECMCVHISVDKEMVCVLEHAMLKFDSQLFFCTILYYIE